MSLLSRLFKPKAPETLESQLSHIASLDSHECLTIAQDANQVNALRVAAINKLPFDTALLQLATSKQPSTIETAARKRVGALLEQGELTLDTLAAQVPDQSTLVALCNYAGGVSGAVIERIDQEDILLDIAQNSPTTQLRQAAAERIQGREALEQLQKVAKQRDKSVYKLVKTKLDVFKAEEAEQARHNREAQALCQQLLQLNKREPDDIFYARLQQVDKQWQQLLDRVDESLRQSYAQARNHCQEKIAALEAEQQALAAQSAAQQQSKQAVHDVQDKLRKLLTQWLASPSPISEENPLSTLLEQQQAALLAAQNHGIELNREQALAVQLQAAGERLQEQIFTLGSLTTLCAQLAETLDNEPAADIEQAEKLIAGIQATLTVTQSVPDITPVEIIEECRTQIKRYRDRQSAQAQQKRKQLHDLTQLVRKGQWAVNNGHVGRSRAILRDIEALYNLIEAVPEPLTPKLEQLKADMEKLGDWHEFAVTPKKQALVKDMQALITTEQPLPERAKQVQKLQDAWRELCKGGQNQDAELWEAFQAAAQEAFAPCKDYFAAQAEEREQNAERRNALLEQLRKYDRAYNWDQADWKEVEKTLKLAREAWVSYWPVPRKAIKSLQAEFDLLLDQFYGRLNEHYEQNKQKKADIVNRAEALLEQTDTQQAIEQAKQLQTQWQSVGHCRRKDDQALWKAFRGHCDQIFAKRQEENAAQQEERKAVQLEAETLLAKLEAILALQGREFFTAKADIDQISADFQNISELPPGQGKKTLLQQYYDTLEKIQKKTELELRHAARQSWLDLLELSDLIRRFELSAIEKQDGTELKQRIDNAISEQQKWPGNTYSSLEKRLESAEQCGAADLDAQLEQLRLLCIRSEISNNLESPAGDKELRMAYQVQQLQQGMGQNASSANETMETIISEWLAVPAISDEHYRPLLNRLSQAWGLPAEAALQSA